MAGTLAFLGSLLLLAGAKGPYTDPNGAFALELPSGWEARRDELGDGIFITQAFKTGDEEGAHIDVVAQKSGVEIDPSQRAQVNENALKFVVQIVEADGSLANKQQRNVSFAGMDAIRMDADYTDEEGGKWKGFLMAVCGKQHAFVLSVRAKVGDAAGLKLVTDHSNTFNPESRTPRAGVASSSSGAGGLFSQESLKTIGAKFKSNLKRESSDKVLAPGEPPLTYGSVANFMNVIEILFDMQFTETEFEATRQRFIEYYTKADAKGKQILANQGASLLQTLTSGTSEEREQSKQEGRAVFENAFKNGAQQGIGYAQVMWSAIERRTEKVATATGTPQKQDWDTNITESDINATLEMLYFMWVSAGRDASDVTMEDIAKIRDMILRELPTMDQQLQLMIANAEKVYAGLRQQWSAASPAQRIAIGQQFGQALDSWGIGAQSSFEQSGGGSSNGSMMADLAVNTAWNSAKTWTTTTSP